MQVHLARNVTDRRR